MLFGEALARLVSGAGLAVIVSRWGGIELLGAYSLVLAWLLLFQTFVSLGIQEFTIREIGSHPDTEEKYIVHFIIIGVISSLIGSCILPLLVLPMSYSAEISTAITIGALTLVPATLATICRSAFLVHRRLNPLVAVAVIDAGITLVVNGYFVVTGTSVVALIVTIVCAKFLAAAVSLIVLHRRVIKIRPEFDRQFCRQLARPLFTFALGNSLGLVSQRINVILLSVVSSIEMVGLFAAASKLLELALMVPGVFAQLALANLSLSYGKTKTFNNTYLDQTFTVMFFLSVPVALAIAVGAPTIMPLIFGDEFRGGAVVLRILMLFFVFENADAIMGVMLKAAGRQGMDVRLYAANPVCNVGLTFLLGPVLGAAGAAIARLVGTVTSAGLRLRYLARHLDTGSGWRQREILLLLDVAVLISLSVASAYIPLVPLVALSTVSAGILVYFAVVSGAHTIRRLWTPDHSSIQHSSRRWLGPRQPQTPTHAGRVVDGDSEATLSPRVGHEGDRDTVAILQTGRLGDLWFTLPLAWDLSQQGFDVEVYYDRRFGNPFTHAPYIRPRPVRLLCKPNDDSLWGLGQGAVNQVLLYLRIRVKRSRVIWNELVPWYLPDLIKRDIPYPVRWYEKYPDIDFRTAMTTLPRRNDRTILLMRNSTSLAFEADSSLDMWIEDNLRLLVDATGYTAIHVVYGDEPAHPNHRSWRGNFDEYQRLIASAGIVYGISTSAHVLGQLLGKPVVALYPGRRARWATIGDEEARLFQYELLSRAQIRRVLSKCSEAT